MAGYTRNDPIGRTLVNADPDPNLLTAKNAKSAKQRSHDLTGIFAFSAFFAVKPALA